MPDAKANGGGDQRGPPKAQQAGNRKLHLTYAALQTAAQQDELHPSGDSGGKRQSGHAPAPVDPQPYRQRQGAQVTEADGERHADGGKTQGVRVSRRA